MFAPWILGQLYCSENYIAMENRRFWDLQGESGMNLLVFDGSANSTLAQIGQRVHVFLLGSRGEK
jgi:hypothetical protein